MSSPGGYLGARYLVFKSTSATIRDRRSPKIPVATGVGFSFWDAIKNLEADGSIKNFGKQEQSALRREAARLTKNLGGIRNLDTPPEVMFVVDLKREHNAVAEARRLNIPIVAVVDTNCDPDEIDHVIPGNDDAIRAIRLITSRISEACIEGRELYKERQQAKADKDVEEESEIEAASADLKPGERKVISDGTDGPVVEIIRKGAVAAKEQVITAAALQRVLAKVALDPVVAVAAVEPGGDQPGDAVTAVAAPQRVVATLAVADAIRKRIAAVVVQVRRVSERAVSLQG